MNFVLATPALADFPFPRLGIWWPDAENETSEKLARYDLVLNEFEFDAGIEKIKSIRTINPKIKIFRPISPTEINWYIDTEINPLLNCIPSDFFLLNLGSKSIKRKMKLE